MSRRSLGVYILCGVIVVLAGVGFAFFYSKTGPHKLDPQLWDQYRSRFITADGRVIDKDNDPKGVTHTEGQGYGMLLAEAVGDRTRFDQLWQWTQSHLRRPDGLFSWKFAACGTQEDCVADKNNASDGDILIAWALLRAGQDWGQADYVAAARDIAKSVSDNLIVSLGEDTLLLPAVEGFSKDAGVVVNLSYWVFPAFNAFTAAFKDPLWGRLSENAPTLLREARFGKWQLPPDWLQLGDGPARPADGFPPRFSFDAVRIPLYLVWGGIADKETLGPFLSFWSAPSPQGVPAWVDLKTDAVAPYAWSAGVASIAQVTEHATHADGEATAKLPTPGPQDGYFSWSLSLLARIAETETKR
jgi:endo-1,4-beta-D-glucanase Y